MPDQKDRLLQSELLHSSLNDAGTERDDSSLEENQPQKLSKKTKRTISMAPQNDI
jgi:hypothetical protein